MTLSGAARRLTMIVGEDDVWRHKPALQRDRAPGVQRRFAGASVFRGLEGYRTSRTPERIEEFLPRLDELVTEGLVVLDDVHVHRYVGRQRTT